MPRYSWSIILLAGSLGVAAVARAANKPVSRDVILYLLNNYVPSASVTGIVKHNGTDFEPDEGYLKKVKAAGQQ